MAITRLGVSLHSTSDFHASDPASVGSTTLCLAHGMWHDSQSATLTLASGWTLLIRDNPASVGYLAHFVAWKLGTTGSNYLFTVPAGNVATDIVAYNGVDNTTPFDVTSTANSGTGSSMSGSITSVTDGAFIDWFSTNAVSPSAPTGYSSNLTTGSTGSDSYAIDAFELNQGTHGTSSPSVTPASTDGWSVIMVALRPAGAGGGSVSDPPVNTPSRDLLSGRLPHLRMKEPKGFKRRDRIYVPASL